MPAAAAGQPKEPGYGAPARNRPSQGTSVGELYAENSGGIESMTQDLSVAARLAVFGLRGNGQQCFIRLGFIAPVQPREGVENLETAHKQNGQGDRVDPVCCASDAVMAIDERLRFVFSGHIRVGPALSMNHASGPIRYWAPYCCISFATR